MVTSLSNPSPAPPSTAPPIDKRFGMAQPTPSISIDISHTFLRRIFHQFGSPTSHVGGLYHRFFY